MKLSIAVRAAFCISFWLGCAGPGKAQTAQEFYKRKTLRVIVGYGPGGGYDLYARLVAEFLPKFLPGNPQSVVQNMQGAGSFVAATYLYDVAPKDGTYFGSLAQTLALDSAVNPESKLDVSRFAYIGRATSNIDLGVASKKSGIASFEDVRKTAYSVAASGGGTTTVVFPSALNMYGGAKFKLVRGYAGTTEIQLAMERGEVDIIGAYGLPGMITSQPGWIEGRDATLIYQASVKRHKLLSTVPTLPELAQDDFGREILHAVASTGDFGRSFLTTPGVPPERLAALRKALQNMLKNPEFRAASEARNLMIDEASGEEMDELARQTTRLSSATRPKIAEVMK